MNDAKGLTLQEVNRFLVRAARVARLVHTRGLPLTEDEPLGLEALGLEGEREARMTRLYLCYVVGTSLQLHFERDLPPGTVLTEALLADDPMMRQAWNTYQELSPWLLTLQENIFPGDPGA